MAKMPVLFVGHGSPMNLVMDNKYTQSLAALGPVIPRPQAVCVVSAHWQTRSTCVCRSAHPRQIYDFYGFPRELYEIVYEPVGAPGLAAKTLQLMGGGTEPDVAGDDSWGDDHAGWAVLKHLYPGADVPFFNISVDMTAPEARHVELAARLAPLREQGVLIIGSGNIVHNLYDVDMDTDAAPDPRGVRFDALVKEALLAGDLDSLVNYSKWGEDALYSVPTTDHYLPLLWAAALREEDDTVSFPCEIMQNRSVSMRSVAFGL